MDKITPAIPGRVSVTSKACKSTISRPTYITKAMDDARPGRRYTSNINTITRAIPIAAAFKELAMASTPRVAPITLERSSVSFTGSAPIRMVEAILFASS